MTPTPRDRVARPRTPACWFNPDAFAPPPAGEFGNIGRNFLVGPGLENFDLGAYKNNRIGERYNFQFRPVLYLNHPNFGAPPLSFPSNFGVVRQTRARRGDASSSRQIEFGVKIHF